MVGINTGIDVGDDAAARSVQTLLRVRKLNDLGCGLIDVAIHTVDP